MPKPRITVGDFFREHSSSLDLRLLAGKQGMDRSIREGTLNRPGLALAGFYQYFADKRLQVFGSAEMNYLKSLSKRSLKNRIAKLLSTKIPGVIFSRSLTPPREMLEEADRVGVPVFKTSMLTMRLINRATLIFEAFFAPSTSEMGSMVDILGVGTLLRGSSGIGKSECVLSLVERGYSLVADDVTRIRLVNGNELLCTSAELTRNHMEVRGIGIINVASMFGVGAFRLEKVLNIVISLVEWEKVDNVDRLGLDREFYEILGQKVPHVILPVRPGRDIARLVEVAALDQKLKSMGCNAALEFNRRLIQNMIKPPEFKKS